MVAEILGKRSVGHLIGNWIFVFGSFPEEARRV